MKPNDTNSRRANTAFRNSLPFRRKLDPKRNGAYFSRNDNAYRTQWKENRPAVGRVSFNSKQEITGLVAGREQRPMSAERTARAFLIVCHPTG
ncbi:hypothetical protein GWI33_014333 [Rhynchophorus ferrugineus]|uniref:Uncharacterized protein n=1 Tax=Rhynchophorus ferrugineus TaxID=354439 RepID=A0A834I588_RHYFE|nr:hypothetical protein GWI33_014333 [Rhynchophorus ferrugineus]